MGVQRTVKKTKVIGHEEYVNIKTGEIESMEVIRVEDRDFNFHKVWMRNFISTLDIIGNQKAKVCFWIIENLTKDNRLLFTYRGISDATGISLDTVAKTMKVLLDADFLRKSDVGYIVNPNILFKGQRSNRMNILNQYQAGTQITTSKAEKIKNIEKTISQLQRQLNDLRKQEAAEDAKIAKKEETA